MTKAKLKIPKNYKPITSESSCLFTVSVGYEDLDGEELNSIFQTLNTTFKSCTINHDFSSQEVTMGYIIFNIIYIIRIFVLSDPLFLQCLSKLIGITFRHGTHELLLRQSRLNSLFR